MVSESLVASVLEVVLAVGGPLLVVLFYAEGLVIGKLVQPPAVFVAYVALVVPATPALIVLSVACILACTLGQWTLYRGFNDDSPDYFGLRQQIPWLASFPDRVEKRIGKRRLDFVERVLDRYGAPGICLVTIVPGIRGLPAIPAGLSSYPRGRFLVATAIGNAVYVGILVGVAFGLLSVFGLYG